MADVDRYCLITGAAGGIGRALVKAFDNAGYGVIGLDLSPQPSDLECRYWIACDLSKLVNDVEVADEVSRLVSEIVGGSGLHALINNAAVQVLGGVESLTRENWRQTINVNLLAPFFLAQGLMNLLVKAQGSVINIGSIHAQLTKKNFVAYATSKAALAGMTKAMAVDIGCRVRVNAIEPAAVDTEMLRSGFGTDEEKLQTLRSYHPTLTIGKPEEVAEVAIVLVGDDLGFMNGSLISLNGGIGSVLSDPN